MRDSGIIPQQFHHEWRELHYGFPPGLGGTPLHNLQIVSHILQILHLSVYSGSFVTPMNSSYDTKPSLFLFTSLTTCSHILCTVLHQNLHQSFLTHSQWRTLGRAKGGSSPPPPNNFTCKNNGTKYHNLCCLGASGTRKHTNI